MKLVSSQTIVNPDNKIISDKPEKNAIRSAFAGKISFADSEGSNEWMMHVFFETDIGNVDFVVPHAAIVGQSGRKGLFILFYQQNWKSDSGRKVWTIFVTLKVQNYAKSR